jgi:hypothetical protein
MVVYSEAGRLRLCGTKLLLEVCVERRSRGTRSQESEPSTKSFAQSHRAKVLSEDLKSLTPKFWNRKSSVDRLRSYRARALMKQATLQLYLPGMCIHRMFRSPHQSFILSQKEAFFYP